MAGADRRTRYIIDYVANLAPVRRLLALQERFNRLIGTGSSAIRNLSSGIQVAYSAIISRTSSLVSVASRVGQTFGSMGSSIRNALSTTKLEMLALGATISGVMSRVMSSGVKAAADAQEIMNRFNTSFATILPEAQSVAQRMQDDLRLGKVTTANYLAGVQDLLVGFGYAQKEALGLSDSVVRLALDLASWNNIPFDTALQNMQSGLVGNHEALRGLRIVITQSTLEQKALQMGINKSWREIDEATKVMLRYQVAVDQSKNAVGDLQRTLHETTNRFRFFSEQMKTIAVSIFPKFTDWLGVVAEKFGLFIQANEQSFTDIGDYLEIVGVWLDKATNHVISFLSKWQDLDPVTQQLILFVGSVAAVSAPILGIVTVLGRLMLVMSVWTFVIAGAALVIQDIYSVMRGGDGYFRDFLDYFGWTTDSVREFVASMKLWVSETLTSISTSEGLKTAWSAIWGVFKQTWDILKNDVWPVVQMVWGFFKDNVGIFAPAFNALIALVRGALAALGIVFAVLTGNTERITQHFNTLKDAVMSFFVNGFSTFIQWVKGAFSLLTTLVPNVLQGLMSVIMNIVGSGLQLITHTIVAVFGFVFKSIGFILTKIFSGLSNVAAAIKNIFVSVFESIVTFTLDSILTIISKIRGISSFLPNWVQKRLGLGSDGGEGSPANVPTPVLDALPQNNVVNVLPVGSELKIPQIETPQMVIPEGIVQETTGGVQPAGGGSTQDSLETSRSPEVRDVEKAKTPGGNITVGSINIPIVLPENFSGNPEEIRRLVAEEAQNVVGSIFNIAYDDNSGVV